MVGHLQSGSVRDSIGAISSTIRSAGHPDPRLDADGKQSVLLYRQYRAYAKVDKPTKKQKAITTPVLLKMKELASTPLDHAIADLVIGAFFFAMRSCEYSTVSNKDTKTKRLCLRCIRFFRQRTELHLSADLSSADSVSITFENQKNMEIFETITLHANGDPVLCPVKAWTAIVQRVLSIPGSTIDSPVNLVWSNNEIKEIPSTLILSDLRSTVEIMGREVLGYLAEDIGTHSLRSGCAMALHLAELPEYTIKLIGRWKSDAFLVYIRPQIKEFSCGVTYKMIQVKPFYTIPAPAKPVLP